MSSVNFHIYVNADARVGLYRTLLSIWKLENLPDVVSIFHPPGKREIVEKSVFTVSEDTSECGPPLRLIERSGSLEKALHEDVQVFDFEVTGFLQERDMLLPSYTELMREVYKADQVTGIGYYQRQRFGNSKLTIPKVGSRNPIASMIIKRSHLSSLIATTNFLEEETFYNSKALYLVKDSNKGRVVVQSNTASPFDL